MLKEWKKYPEKPGAKKLAQELDITELTARALMHRGIEETAEARAFLHPEEMPFFDPFLMKDMDAAVERIAKAIKKREKIVVYGDYDVDGMTATSLLVHNLRALGALTSCYIPDRKTEGYGFNLKALQSIADGGAGLLVSVDCGIASVDDVRAMGGILDIVITDHHLPGEKLPPALAVVNPHRADCPYPDKHLAGVGVAFKLCQALWQQLRGEEFSGDLELVALGTVADIVPLLGENRKIVKMGLEKLQESDFLGVRALVEAAGLKDKEITAGHIGFMLAPRLNAAGRLGSGRDGVRLLLSRDIEESESLAKELDALNGERQAIEAEILAAAEAELQSQEQDPEDMAAIVVAGKGWNPGVIGIVASRLVEKYYKPTVILAIQEDGFCKGSCRSIEGLHMYEALTACKEYLTQFGGHEMAAGLSLQEDKIDDFRRALQEYAGKKLTAQDYVPKVMVEFELPPQEVNFRIIEELALLEPYGMGNPKPTFGYRGLRGTEAQTMGAQRQHLKFQAGTADRPVTALYWNHSALAPIVNAEELDLVYTPSINEWNGRRSLQCFVESLAPAESGRKFPERDTLAGIYRFLLGVQKQQGKIPYSAEELAASYRAGGEDISLYTFAKGLRIFQELGLLHQTLEEAGYYLPSIAGKMDLEASPTYRRHR